MTAKGDTINPHIHSRKAIQRGYDNRVSSEEDQYLDAQVTKAGRSKEFYVRDIFERGLENL